MRLIDADELKKNWTGIDTPVGYRKVVDLEIIDNAPTVNPEPYFEKAEKDKRIYEQGFKDGQNERPQGEWVFRNGVTCVGYYKCSNCGEVERTEKNYCPNCGADMRGEEK